MDPIDLIRDGKIKRHFRANRKLNVPKLVYHITQRAAGKEPLFMEESDYLFMLGLIKEISENHDLRIYAFCLMPNHIHLLLSISKKNLYDAMRDLFSRYAMKFNRKYERKGHLFGGPYRQAVCLDDSYLLAASVYIHMNPVKAALAKDPRNYRWSSIRLFCDGNSKKSFVDPAFILGLLSGGDLERKKQYRHMMKRGIEIQTGNVLEQEGAVESFRAKLVAIFPSLFSKVVKKRKIAKSSGLDLLSIEELDKQIEAVRTDNFSNKPESRKAKKYLIEQLIARGFKRDEITERLGVSTKTIYNILKSPTQ